MDDVKDGDFRCGFCNRNLWIDKRDEEYSTSAGVPPCSVCLYPKTVHFLKSIAQELGHISSSLAGIE